MLNPRQAKARKVRIKREKAKRDAESSLASFARQAWKIVEPAREYKHNWHVDCIAEHLEAVTERDIRNLIINIPPRHMKMCIDSTPVLTPKGWRNHGDLEIGDEVFHPSGRAIKVMALSLRGIGDTKVELTNGEVIQVNGDHLWTVYNRSMRIWETRSTRDLMHLKIWSGNRAIFQLPDIKCLEFKERKHDLPAYFIGAWLGDGTAVNPIITHDINDVEHIKKISNLGIKVTKQGLQKGNSVRSFFTKQGILERLRTSNLYNNKHIPDEYKFGSLEQRLELMAGLIDTDGHVNENGRVRISTSNPRLRDDIFEVATTLGWRPYIIESKSPGYEQYGDDKPHYQIGFNPIHLIPLAIDRKKKNLKINHVRRRIGIKSISKCEPEEGNCIQVDSPDGLYLVGRQCVPTHNSLLVSVFWPSWVWGPNQMPSECWLYGSYSPKLATRDSVKARRIIEDPWYMMNWGRQFFDSDDAFELGTSLLRADQNEKMRYENLRAGTRISTTPGGTGTGDGGDIVAIDDPHKVKGIESTVQRESVIDWWDNEMGSRAMDPMRVCKVIIMQRVHDQDLCGHALTDSETDWEHLCLPFEFEKKPMVDFRGTHLFKFKDDPRTEEGELLWKDRYDDQAIRALKGPMTPYQKSGQLQQRPTPKEGTTFKRHWFEKSRRWNHDNIPDKFQHVLDSWDLTFKGKKGQAQDNSLAYNVGWKLGLLKPDIYVLNQFRKQMGIIGQKKYIPEFRGLDDRTREIIIERAANGEATAELLRQKIPGVILVTPRGSKEDRADAVTWLFEGGNIIFPEDDLFPWVKEAIEEIIGFGPKAKYKDRVDAIVHGIERLSKKMRRVGFDLGDHSKLSGWALGN